MISFLKRLGRDRRGNALVIAGAALPLVLGSAGLATDTIHWALWKRQLQRAADSAAIAGVYARFQNQAAATAVTQDLTTNNHTVAGLVAGYPQVQQPANVGTNTNTVQVGLAAQKELGFSSLFLNAAPILQVTATAAAVDDGIFCVVALENTTTSGIIIQGSTTVNLGCGMISNSTSASVSVGVNGNAHTVTADPVAGVGGVPDINGVTNEQSYHLAQLDPYANKYSTDVPAGMSCGNMNSHVVSEVNGVTTLSPGCYSGNNSFKFSGGNYQLQPGTYYLSNADFKATGGTISGTGVTIILTGNSPGQVDLSGNANINLTAPTTGTFARMLLMQSPNASNINNANMINGSSTSSFDGAFYFPNQQVTFSGTTGAMTKCAMVVARRVQFSGNSNMQNNTTGCVANSTVMGKKVRLIA